MLQRQAELEMLENEVLQKQKAAMEALQREEAEKLKAAEKVIFITKICDIF